MEQFQRALLLSLQMSSDRLLQLLKPVCLIFAWKELGCAPTDQQLNGNSSLQPGDNYKQPESRMWKMTSSCSLTEITMLEKQTCQFWYKNVFVVLPSLILHLASGLWPPKQVVHPLFPSPGTSGSHTHTHRWVPGRRTEGFQHQSPVQAAHPQV